jgi:hypothetical protein
MENKKSEQVFPNIYTPPPPPREGEVSHTFADGDWTQDRMFACKSFTGSYLKLKVPKCEIRSLGFL